MPYRLPYQRSGATKVRAGKLLWRTGAAGLAFAVAGAALAFNPAAGDFDKPAANLVRVMTWNVHNNFIYTGSKDGNYSRVIKAVKPDVIAFQEMDVSLSATQISNRLESYFPGSTWHVYLGKADGGNAGVSNRNVIASKYPLSMKRNDTVPTSAIRGVTMALIDLPNGSFAKDLYLSSVHFKAGVDLSDQQSRQKHADAITNWMRDARNSGGNVTLPYGTPMMVVGDTNILRKGERAPNHPGKTMLDGTILNTGRYGQSSKPDWDGTNNSDASPYDYNNGETWTHGSSNPSTRIDRFYYTDSVIHTVTKFVINTKTMTAAARAAANLNKFDTSGASDHLPAAVDFALGESQPGKLRVNEFCANNPGADDRTFIELINTGGEEINLDGPVDYWIKASEPLPTSQPSAENEEFAWDLQGVVPPGGGLFVLYDGAGESAAIKSTVESNLPKLQRQNLDSLMMRNFNHTAFSLVKRDWLHGKTIEDNVETYGYAAPNPNTTRYFKLDSGNHRTITVGPNQWTDFLVDGSGSDLTMSRNVGTSAANNYLAWTKGATDTPGQQNATQNIIDNSDPGFSASQGWATGASAIDKYGADYRFHNTQAVSDACVWNFSVPLPGDYEIFAWWSQGGNRSISAPYLMPDGSTVYRNQQANGGSWQSLGVYSLAAGNHDVRLSCWTTNGTVVIGDAVKILPVN